LHFIEWCVEAEVQHHLPRIKTQIVNRKQPPLYKILHFIRGHAVA
jgi:hypothetical protein